MVGILLIISICIMPIIKLIILCAGYGLMSALSEPIADKRIMNLLEQMTGTFKLLLGIMFFIAVLLIIGLAMTIKISNAGLMYR